jgi:hypothetical protein
MDGMFVSEYMQDTATGHMIRVSKDVIEKETIKQHWSSNQWTRPVVAKVCALAPLGAVTSSQKHSEILRNFHNFISISNSMS